MRKKKTAVRRRRKDPKLSSFQRMVVNRLDHLEELILGVAVDAETAAQGAKQEAAHEPAAGARLAMLPAPPEAAP